MRPRVKKSAAPSAFSDSFSAELKQEGGDLRRFYYENLLRHPPPRKQNHHAAAASAKKKPATAARSLDSRRKPALQQHSKSTLLQKQYGRIGRFTAARINRILDEFTRLKPRLNPKEARENERQNYAQLILTSVKPRWPIAVLTHDQIERLVFKFDRSEYYEHMQLVMNKLRATYEEDQPTSITENNLFDEDELTSSDNEQHKKDSVDAVGVGNIITISNDYMKSIVIMPHRALEMERVSLQLARRNKECVNKPWIVEAPAEVLIASSQELRGLDSLNLQRYVRDSERQQRASDQSLLGVPDDVEQRHVRRLVHYALYGQLCGVNWRNVVPLMRCAEVLQIETVQQFCMQFLRTLLHTNNLIFLIELAYKERNVLMYRLAREKLTRSFYEIVNDAYYLTWPPRLILKLIKMKDLVVFSEFDVFMALSNWTDPHPYYRRPVLKKAMRYLNLRKMTFEEIDEMCRMQPDLQLDQNIRNILAHENVYNSNRGNVHGQYVHLLEAREPEEEDEELKHVDWWSTSDSMLSSRHRERYVIQEKQKHVKEVFYWRPHLSRSLHMLSQIEEGRF